MTTTLKLFVVKHEPSGKYIPTRANGRGGSFLEPKIFDGYHGSLAPRLFKSEASARNFLSQWLVGRHIYSRDQDGICEFVRIDPVPSRKKEEMKILPITLELP